MPLKKVAKSKSSLKPVVKTGVKEVVVATGAKTSTRSTIGRLVVKSNDKNKHFTVSVVRDAGSSVISYSQADARFIYELQGMTAKKAVKTAKKAGIITSGGKLATQFR